MRVLMVSNLYPPYWIGGYELMASWVAEGLRERNHAVTVLTGRGAAFDGVADIDPGLDLDLAGLVAAHFADGIAFERGLVRDWRRHVFNRRNQAACAAAIERVRPDLVSFWNPAFITFSPLRAARRMGVPTVVHLSDVVANPFRNPHPPAFVPAAKGMAKMAVDALLRRLHVRMFVVPSSALAARLVADEALPPRRTIVLPWPVPRDLQAPQDRPVRASRLLFVGSLSSNKGPEVLLHAFRIAWNVRPQLTLTLIGDADRASVARLREQAAGLPVEFCGRLTRPEVEAAYRLHDVLVFPSVWEEPFAIVPLEAMAMGLVVIASATGGTAEAVKHDATGLLVPPGDRDRLAEAILQIVGDPARARTLAAAGQRWARETRAFPSFMDRLTDVYEEARSGPGART